MSRFTSVNRSTDGSSAISDGMTLNALTVTGAALGAATIGGSLFVAATVAPAQTIGLAGASAVCAIAGKRMADGKTAIPGVGQKADASAPAAAPATAA